MLKECRIYRRTVNQSWNFIRRLAQRLLTNQISGSLSDQLDQDS